MRSKPQILAALAAAAALSVAAAPGCRDRDPNTPIAIVGTPATQGGHAVVVTYLLRNPDTVGASVSPQFSTDGGGSFRDATPNPQSEGTTNLAASPGGTTHVFLWDALADVGPGRHSGVVFRIVPFAGARGTTADSFFFTIDDTDLFVGQGDLAFPRQRGAAAALPDGGAIVAGGGNLAGTTEAYVPTAEAMVTSDALDVPREGAVAETALALDGALLEPTPFIFAGGGAGGTTLTSVERFDPGADVWTSVAGLDVGARTGHTVTRLADGRFLVAGGGPASDLVVDLSNPAAPATATVTAGAARSGHAASLLPDGRVLVTGGTAAGGAVLATALVFSPATNLYSAGPALAVARTGHAAALTGGRVLVAGGRDASGAVTGSAEVADAALAAFSLAAGGLATPRASHTATGLPGGGVVVVGGADAAGRSLASAERYVPALDAFVATRGGLETPRQGHQATPFGPGRILITGGGTDAVEVYYAPSQFGSQSFDPIATASAGRAEHQVTSLLDGRALVTGGTSGVVKGGSLVALNTAEVVTPNTLGSARSAPLAGTMTAARRRHTATLLDDGTVLLVGGVDSSGATLGSLETFDPAAGTFSSLPEALPFGLSDHAATSIGGGYVMIAGGRLANGDSSGAMFFFHRSTSPRLVTATVQLLTPRQRHTLSFATTDGLNGTVAVVGGIVTGGLPTASAEFISSSISARPCTGPICNPAVTGFPDVAGVARFDHAAVPLDDGSLLIAGGFTGTLAAPGTPTADVRIIGPLASTFTAGVPMLHPRADFAAVSLPGARALFAGGAAAAAPGDGSDLLAPITSSAEVYTPAGNTTTATTFPGLSSVRRGMRAARLGDGTTAIIGGRREAGATVPAGDRFTP